MDRKFKSVRTTSIYIVIGSVITACMIVALWIVFEPRQVHIEIVNIGDVEAHVTENLFEHLALLERDEYRAAFENIGIGDSTGQADDHHVYLAHRIKLRVYNNTSQPITIRDYDLQAVSGRVDFPEQYFYYTTDITPFTIIAHDFREFDIHAFFDPRLTPGVLVSDFDPAPLAQEDIEAMIDVYLTAYVGSMLESLGFETKNRSWFVTETFLRGYKNESLNDYFATALSYLFNERHKERIIKLSFVTQEGKTYVGSTTFHTVND